MKMKFINICLFTAGCLFVTGCNDDNEIFFEDLTGNKALEWCIPMIGTNLIRAKSMSFL